jgi:calcium-dependent protein kinase
MSPEVFRREYGTEADMWSLGIMLYLFMTGHFPFW